MLPFDPPASLGIYRQHAPKKKIGERIPRSVTRCRLRQALLQDIFPLAGAIPPPAGHWQVGRKEDVVMRNWKYTLT